MIGGRSRNSAATGVFRPLRSPTVPPATASAFRRRTGPGRVVGIGGQIQNPQDVNKSNQQHNVVTVASSSPRFEVPGTGAASMLSKSMIGRLCRRAFRYAPRAPPVAKTQAFTKVYRMTDDDRIFFPGLSAIDTFRRTQRPSRGGSLRAISRPRRSWKRRC